MTKNWEVFQKDPRQRTIPNQGVTKVGPPQDEGDWEVLKWELSSFVCEGEYARGLERILSSYLSNLSRPEQAAVWVSGFFGSGKSHLVRVLAALWSDLELPDGSTARGLAKLPQEIQDALAELSGAGKRAGGLWSAAGKLGTGAPTSYRMAFLSVLFESAGLPTQYPAARLAIKLKEEGVYESVLDQVRNEGKNPWDEFLNLYVSPVLAQAVIDSLPDFASDEHEARAIFREQYPNVSDIAGQDLELVMEDVLVLQSEKIGEIPCTVIVLDELQQYVGDDNEKLYQVQNVAELCATHFDSKVMLVTTGQSALQGSPMLSKIQDRFYERIELSDQDVENVIRTVILQKKPKMTAALEEKLTTVSGEIDSHLTGTRIAPHANDADDLIPDYPLLPTRLRFWENALRAVDRGGGTGQLRTQLRIAHEATQEVAEHELGFVVPADFLFFRQADPMLSTRVLSRDMLERIKGHDDGTPHGKLKSRVLGLIFLISQLPTDEGADLGIRARPDYLADLLVEDLAQGSDNLRSEVEGALTELEHDGALLKIDSQYRLQTPEGEELQRRFMERSSQIRSDTSRIHTERDRELRDATEGDLAAMKLIQGKSKTPRKLDLAFGPEPPNTIGDKIPVWIQDEWSVAKGDFTSDARKGGVTDPTVHVLLPRLNSDRLRDALADWHAADEVLAATPIPETPEGVEARLGLETKRHSLQSQVAALISDVLANAVVMQGGGTDVAEGSLKASVEKAATASLARKFPRFPDADHDKWGTVLSRAREGDPNALEAVGHQDEPDKHSVAKAILGFLSATGTKGSEIRSHFDANEYGWPKDAIDGALVTLVAAGRVRSQSKQGNEVTAKDLNQRDIATSSFRPETVLPPSVKTVLEIRQKITEANEVLASDEQLPSTGGDELEAVSRLLQIMLIEARNAGGDPPLPENPDTSLVEELLGFTGNELLREFHAEMDKLLDAHVNWASRAKEAVSRSPEWERLGRLLHHFEPHADHQTVSTDVSAIIDQRLLLDDPDPIPPIRDRITDEIRKSLKDAHKRLASVVKEARKQVAASDEWGEVGDKKGEMALAEAGLEVAEAPKVSTTDELLRVLDRSPLSDWEDKIAAVPTKLDAARAKLAEFAQPKLETVQVKLPNATLHTEADVDDYVEKVRNHLKRKLGDDKQLIV